MTAKNKTPADVHRELSLQVYDTTSEFILGGSQLKTALYERSKRHQQERLGCLDEISTLLTQAAQEADVSKAAASLVVTLVANRNLTGKALVIKALVDRTVFLQIEEQELTCVGKNLIDTAFYKLTVPEALRYGLL